MLLSSKPSWFKLLEATVLLCVHQKMTTVCRVKAGVYGNKIDKVQFSQNWNNSSAH